jgi:hypothetical protein
MRNKKLKKFLSLPLSRLSLVDVNECTYEVVCTTVFGDKKLAPVAGSYHLRDFKVHDYNAKAIKTVEKAAERTKVGFEMESCIATLSGIRLKQTFYDY